MKTFYRPEIDGLRAVAVGAVIFYHSHVSINGVKPFSGGFIGVDIFFVISGYLITSIILKELICYNTFSLKYFYERRIRRILPVLLFILLASIPFAWLFLLPESFIDFSKSIISSLGFASNFYFHFSDLQYGGGPGLLKPFLHTWSLSVEEQYYLIFPFILIIVIKFYRKFLIHFIIFFFLISLFFADYGSRNYPSSTFYLIHARIWELLSGSILSYFEITLNRRGENKILKLCLPSIGFFLIIISIFYFNDEMRHPSYYTLIPIIGVSVILWFSNKNEIITKILSSRLFVSVGLISYSLYLWHYPIFSFSRITNFATGDILKKILLLIIILLLSIITYFFIEKPFRNKKNNFKIILTSILFFFFLILTINIYIIKKEGFKDRFPEIIYNIPVGNILDLLKDKDGKTCFGNTNGCKFNISSTNKVYIIGDSHMASLSYDLKERFLDSNHQFIVRLLRGCLFYPGFDRQNIQTTKNSKKCNDNYFANLINTINKDKNSTIIIGGRYSLYLSNKFFNNQEGGIENQYEPNGINWKHKFIPIKNYQSMNDSFKNEIIKLSEKHKVILVYPIPEVGWDPKKQILLEWFKKKNKNYNNINLASTSYNVYQERNRSVFDMLNSINSENIYRVFPHKIFCNSYIKNRCATHDGKNIFYSDDDHPSLIGSKMINNLIIKEIKKIDKSNLN